MTKGKSVIKQDEQVKQDVKYDINEFNKMTSTSSKIRYLSSCGLTQNEIHKEVNKLGVTTKDGKEIRYQHVRNVLVTQLKKQ